LTWINTTTEDFGPGENNEVRRKDNVATARLPETRSIAMIVKKLILCCGLIALAGPAYAQVELKTYADRDGYIDVQKLTCAQLANTFQEDADYLTVWYSGWYNGFARST
jgi:hypothetical protein